MFCAIKWCWDRGGWKFQDDGFSKFLVMDCSSCKNWMCVSGGFSQSTYTVCCKFIQMTALLK